MRRPRGDLRSRDKGPRINHQIRIPEVRVVDAEGEMIGVMQTREAQDLARDRDMDLVEINPKSRPPVCKVIDYGRYKYDKKKQESEQRKRRTVTNLKEVKLRPKTDDHDLKVKASNARRFLTSGDKVKVTCRFRGREITHPNVARDQLMHIAQEVQDVGSIEVPARMEGRTMTLILAPSP